SLLPFGEPELFGTVVHHPLVERAVVGDQAAEPVGPVAGDPVGHVPAVRGAEGADTVAVQPGIAGDGGGEPLLQVLQRLASPVFLDRVGEGLAVAGRTVEVDGEHGVAGAGVELGV